MADLEKEGVFKTSRYEITFKELSKGGPGGYESTYLTSVGDNADNELYNLLDSLNGKLLLSENRSVRQRSGSQLVEALKEGKNLGIASGFKPSGAYHFGHSLVALTLAFFQKNGAQIFTPIADVEAYMDKMPREDYLYWAADNLLDFGAGGLNLDAAHVYLQSEERRVSDLAYLVARGLTFDLPVDFYGMKKMIEDFPFLFAGITQVGDIILPQHKDFGNYHSFMVSGQDQDGHMKMTVELTTRAFNSGIKELYGIQTIPSGFYIPHIRGISGYKASSRKTESTLYLGSGPQREDLDERIRSTFSKLCEANPYHIKRCALDMVRFIDIFNKQNTVDFIGILEENSYKGLASMRDSKKSNEIISDMDKDEFRIISWLFEEYKAGELNEAKTPEEKREREEEIEKNKVRIKNQFLSQHRFDEYLLNECESMGQNNFELVRGNLPEALTQHQKRRQEVLNYAIARENYKSTAWDIENAKPEQPSFWKVPKRAIVDSSLRNPTQWFNLVSNMKDKLIP